MNIKKIKIILSSDGQEMSYLHADAVPLQSRGGRVVRRASDVEFDASTQEWVATLMDGREIARNASRDAVLAAERQVIEKMLEAQEAIPGCH